MLDVMRKHAQGPVVKILLGVIALVFVFFMGGGAQIGGNSADVATVGGTKISLTELQRAQSRNQAFYREQYGDRLTPELMSALNLPRLSLEQLVDQAVLRGEAERLGLRVPDAAIRSEIREIAVFQRSGQFSPDAYRAVMQRQGMSPSAFEGTLRNDLLVEQLVDIVRRGVHITDDEAFEQYARDNEKLTLEYVKVLRSNIQDEIVANEDELASFYEDVKEEYRVPESVSIRYLSYAPDGFADPATISDEAIEEYYVLNKESEFTSEELVSARHILKKFPIDADDEAKKKTREAIEKVAERLAAGEDFATVAGEESEDTGSGVEGGDLGEFGRNRMVKPFEEAAFALEVDGTSEIIESSFGYHIIRVYDRKEAGTRTFEEVRGEIADKLAKDSARDVAFDAAAEDALAIREGTSVATIEASRDLKIEVTAPLNTTDILPGIGSAKQFVETALALSGPDDVADPIRVGEVYYVLQVEKRVESYLPELDDVREDATKAYRKEQAGELARARATELMAELKAGKTTAELAEADGVESGETKEFTRQGAFIPGLGNMPGLKQLAFETTDEGDVLPRVFPHRGDGYAFVLKSRTSVERQKFDDVREARIASLRRSREQLALSEFVRGLKDRMKISYNEQLLKQFLPTSTN